MAGAGCANLHSTSGREHLFRWNSLQTSSCNHLLSFWLSKVLKFTKEDGFPACCWVNAAAATAACWCGWWTTCCGRCPGINDCWGFWWLGKRVRLLVAYELMAATGVPAAICWVGWEIGMIVLLFIGEPAATEVTTEGWFNIVPPPSAMIGDILGPRLHNCCCWSATAWAVTASSVACLMSCWFWSPGFVEEERGWILGMVDRSAAAWLLFVPPPSSSSETCSHRLLILIRWLYRDDTKKRGFRWFA